MNEYTYVLSKDAKSFKDIIGKHPFQSGKFGLFYAEQHGCEVGYISVKQEGLFVANLLFFVKGKGCETFSGFPGGKWLNKVSKQLLPEIVWYGGPSFIGQVNEEEITNYIIHVLGREYGTKRFTADLPFLYGNDKWATYKISLLQSIEDLWNRIDKSAKKNILKTSEKVDVCFVNDEQSVKKYLSLLKGSRKSLGFIYLPPVHVNNLLINYMKGRAKIVLVTEKSSGNSIAAMGLVMGKEVVVEVGSALSSYCRSAKLYCGDLIKWEIVKFAKLNGLKLYDLGGCSPSPTNSKEVSIRRFKKKFGGDYVEYGVLR